MKSATVALWMLLALPGCSAGAAQREDARGLDRKIARAMERGARRCAPAELATAQSHLEFFRYEASRGDSARAEAHRAQAEASIERALEIADPLSCDRSSGLILAEDKDRDGISDDEDRCPEAGEDRDRYRDDDGCPDVDNDKDGVLDVEDRCPMVAGDRTNGGCPIADRDGDGVLDEADACPDVAQGREPSSTLTGCPAGEDVDGDGILPPQDRCPGLAEDVDRFEDDDGCPDTDNDGDTVLDVADACPDEPGSPEAQGCSGARDRDADRVDDVSDACPDVPGSRDNGCPERVLAAKTDEKIEIRRPIVFATGMADLASSSFAVLDQVAAVMRSNPRIFVVVEGHTDDRGEPNVNLELSSRRAQAVRDTLIGRGIRAERLDAIGYGSARPVASNRSSRGRASNRRVEFRIVPTSGTR